MPFLNPDASFSSFSMESWFEYIFNHTGLCNTEIDRKGQNLWEGFAKKWNSTLTQCRYRSQQCARNHEHSTQIQCFLFLPWDLKNGFMQKWDDHLFFSLGLIQLPSKVQEKFTLSPVFLPDSLSRRHLDNNHNWLSAWINLQILIESQRSGFLCWPSTVRSQFGKVCHCYLGRGAIFRLRRCLSGRGKDGSAP